MSALSDSFGRSIRYLRLSVTDRCDFRCVYCMAEDMQFLPRSQVLSLEELAAVGHAFVRLGVSKIRLTGGEPLVRKNLPELVHQLAQTPGLAALAMTTNGARLPQLAEALAQAGLNQLNISLDSLSPQRFRAITRTGDLHQVLKGIDAAQAAGIRRIKLNTVVLRDQNAQEVPALVQFALDRQLDIAFIEEMPLGVISSHKRAEQFLSSAELRTALQRHLNLTPLAQSDSHSGPANYWQVPGHASRIGFISPHSENFCASCNRVRVTAEGRLLLCLGNEHSRDLRQILRQRPQDLEAEIIDAMRHKPEKHHFTHDDTPQILRFMNATGG
jgi:GTP 3',8-cyclase